MKKLIQFLLLTLILDSTLTFAADYQVDEVRVYKTKHRMEMLYKGQITKVYTVMLGRGGMAPKRQEGDKLVPEGKYVLDYKNPHSSFYRSIHISYPNEADIERARDEGVNPGGDIMLHGMPSLLDWTAGCIAVTNKEILEIWNNLEVPTKITIFH
jgi:murein L,D-transpeptidase YafK